MRRALPPRIFALSSSESCDSDDLREQVADPPPDRSGVEVGPEHHAVRTELPREVLDEVEVVAQARVEHDVRRDVGDVEALARRLEAREGVERDDRQVRHAARHDRELPE